MQYSGVMVAFFLPADVSKELASFDSFFSEQSEVTDPQDYHITLAYLPDVPVVQHRLLRDVVSAFAQNEHPVGGRLNGVGRFAKEEEDGTNAFYTSFDSPILPSFRQRLVERLERYNFNVSRMHGFIPHCTMAYIPQSEPSPTLLVPPTPVTFNNIWLAIGQDRYKFSLNATMVALKKRLGKTAHALVEVM